MLYPSYDHSMDPLFDVDLGKPDLDKHPLLALTYPMECILRPGGESGHLISFVKSTYGYSI